PARSSRVRSLDRAPVETRARHLQSGQHPRFSPLAMSTRCFALAGSFLLLMAFAAPGGATAQVEHGGKPPSIQRRLPRAVPPARMRPVVASELLAEDEAQGQHGALRFADVLDVDLDLSNSGAWEELGGGDRVWRLRVESPGAKSLAFVFRRFQLPVGGELYVYDDAHRTVRGAYTELENRLDGEFALRPTRGAAIT